MLIPGIRTMMAAMRVSVSTPPTNIQRGPASEQIPWPAAKDLW